jgi:hypothetical protein
MPKNSPSLRQAVARTGAGSRWGSDDEDARRDLATEQIAAYVDRIVAAAPPLTAEQRNRLTSLLNPSIRMGAQSK